MSSPIGALNDYDFALFQVFFSIFFGGGVTVFLFYFFTIFLE